MAPSGNTYVSRSVRTVTVTPVYEPFGTTAYAYRVSPSSSVAIFPSGAVMFAVTLFDSPLKAKPLSDVGSTWKLPTIFWSVARVTDFSTSPGCEPFLTAKRTTEAIVQYSASILPSTISARAYMGSRLPSNPLFSPVCVDSAARLTVASASVLPTFSATGHSATIVLSDVALEGISALNAFAATTALRNVSPAISVA